MDGQGGALGGRVKVPSAQTRHPQPQPLPEYSSWCVKRCTRDGISLSDLHRIVWTSCSDYGEFVKDCCSKCARTVNLWQRALYPRPLLLPSVVLQASLERGPFLRLWLACVSYYSIRRSRSHFLNTHASPYNFTGGRWWAILRFVPANRDWRTERV